MSAKAKFVLCEDGSYLQVRNITRLFLAVDTVSREAKIKASVIGPAMPFTVADYPTKAEAVQSLQILINSIEGNFINEAR